MHLWPTITTSSRLREKGSVIKDIEAGSPPAPPPPPPKNTVSTAPRAANSDLPRHKPEGSQGNNFLPGTALYSAQPPRGSGNITRVAISQSYFHDDPTNVYSVNTLRGILERDGFFEKKLTFIVVEGQHDWVAGEFSRRKLGCPQRLWEKDFAIGSGLQRPVALPQASDGGGFYAELDVPTHPTERSLSTRIRIYVHVRPPRGGPSPSSAIPSSEPRLQNTFAYYSHPSRNPSTHQQQQQRDHTANSPRLVIFIVTPTTPASTASPTSPPSLTDCLKRYYRSHNQLRISRLMQNPGWIAADLMTIYFDSEVNLDVGSAWMDSLVGPGAPVWENYLPRRRAAERRRGALWSWWNRHSHGSIGEIRDIQWKLRVLHAWVERASRVRGMMEAQRAVVSRFLALVPMMELAAPASPTLVVGGGVAYHTGGHRRAESHSSIEEEPEITATAGTAKTSSTPAQTITAHRTPSMSGAPGPSNLRVSTSSSGSFTTSSRVPSPSSAAVLSAALGVAPTQQQPQPQQQQHQPQSQPQHQTTYLPISNRYSSSSFTIDPKLPHPTTSTTTPSSNPCVLPTDIFPPALPFSQHHFPHASSSSPPPPPQLYPTSHALISTLTAQDHLLLHNISHITCLASSAANLIAYLNEQVARAQRGILATIAAVLVVLGPLAFVAGVLSMIGWGRGAGEAWVYPVVGVVVCAGVAGVVGIVRWGLGGAG